MMNYYRFLNIIFVIFITLIVLPINLEGRNIETDITIQNNDSLTLIKKSTIENTIGEKLYSKWLKSKNQTYLDSSQLHFINAYNILPIELKPQYSLEKSRLFHKNIENSIIVKDWYLRAINSIKVNSYQDVDTILKKYEIVKEFIKAYSVTYKLCDEALEILQNYKTDLCFNYIYKNPKEKKLPILREELELEDQNLTFNCIPK